MKLTMTRPLRTATPDKAMNPTRRRDRERNVAQPQRKNATGERQRYAGEDDRRIARLSRGPRRAAPAMISNVTGTTIASRLRGRLAAARRCRRTRSSSLPACSTCSATARSTSCTNEPRSRPRTFAVTTTRRLPFSRLIWLTPVVELQIGDFAQWNVAALTPAERAGRCQRVQVRCASIPAGG